MLSERMQRQIERLLDEAERAVIDRDWELVEARCQAVLGLDPENVDARSYRDAATRARTQGVGEPGTAVPATPPSPPLPSAFANGRY